jgi:hypothetical protein
VLSLVSEVLAGFLQIFRGIPGRVWSFAASIDPDWGGLSAAAGWLSACESRDTTWRVPVEKTLTLRISSWIPDEAIERMLALVARRAGDTDGDDAGDFDEAETGEPEARQG